MKIPAIRAKIGIWTYYVTTMTFRQVADNVSKVDDELHTSNSLKELIQRSITDNYISIKNYIINQNELFFNSLVLAVYNNYPNWIEVELKYDNEETYQVGLLDFSGPHKIFPVDGQHRVEGIKAALEEQPELENQTVGVIFIGHSNDASGMQKTRRLFSTLNRYAKPVTMDDIIALDEDDAIAITTRELLEGHPLFKGKNVTKSQNKAIPNDDKDAITSIITLYECNKELLKLYRIEQKKNNPDKSRDKKDLKEYLKFRPKEEDITEFKEMCFNFWDTFIESFPAIKDFVSSTETKPALQYRNNNDGGNLLFRPVGLLPFVIAVVDLHLRFKLSFQEIFAKFSKIDFTICNKPWRQVMWNSYSNTMIMSNQLTTRLLLLYLFDENSLKVNDAIKLKDKYAAAINYDGNKDEVLDTIK
jgi:DNA sulfur modification protein DndB